MPPSSNWLALKKNLKGSKRHEDDRPTKRRKVEVPSEHTSDRSVASPAFNTITVSEQTSSPVNRDSVEFLRKMVCGQVQYSPAHNLPGKYLAIDCEMVGIAGGPKDPSLPGKQSQGDESSLARVSVVNYHGAVQLDVFVQQRERVTDWRTEFSGVRESDMVNAKPFSEVQKMISDMLKDRILVGHAVHNDLKVLLLSHPFTMTRDTQILAGSHGTLTTTSKQTAAASSSEAAAVKTRRNRKPALRKLVSQELGIAIQRGEHSSIIDARATMAIYRLHRKVWDQRFRMAGLTHERKQFKTQSETVGADGASSSGSTSHKSSLKRKRPTSAELAVDAENGSDVIVDDKPRVIRERRPKSTSSSGKGLSSGLSVVVKTRQRGSQIKRVVAGTRGAGSSREGSSWWETLG